MAILLSGDFHANEKNELNVITKEALITEYGREKFGGIKYHVILGDGGFMWPGNYKRDLVNYRALAQRPFPVLCVIGNHEPILGVENKPETDIGIGETVYQIQDEPFVAYLKRGKVYTIDGFKFLVLGGGLSIDNDYRTPNVSWWEQEYWSEQEKRDIFKLLETENAFDGVLSHTGPERINKRLFKRLMYPFTDEVADLNEEIDNKLQCRDWWCGHWHNDAYHYDETMKRGYRFLYKTTNILDRSDNKMTVHHEGGKK
jgi:hypothetical protein